MHDTLFSFLFCFYLTESHSNYCFFLFCCRTSDEDNNGDDSSNASDDPNTSDTEYPAVKQQRPPLRSYRCTTNMATLQEFNAAMKIDSDGEETKDDEMLMCFNYDKRLSYSLFVFSEQNLLRRFCKKLTGNKYLFHRLYFHHNFM